MPKRKAKKLTHRQWLDRMGWYTGGRARSTLTIQALITREAIRSFANTNRFLSQYDDHCAVENAKIGSTLRIRLPNDYKVVEQAQAIGWRTKAVQALRRWLKRD